MQSSTAEKHKTVLQRTCSAKQTHKESATLALHCLSLSLSPAPSVPFCYLLCFVLLLRGPHLQGSAVADFYRFDCSLCSLRRDAADFAVAGRRQRAAVRSSCLMLYIFIVLTLFSWLSMTATFHWEFSRAAWPHCSNKFVVCTRLARRTHGGPKWQRCPAEATPYERYTGCLFAWKGLLQWLHDIGG